MTYVTKYLTKATGKSKSIFSLTIQRDNLSQYRRQLDWRVVLCCVDSIVERKSDPAVAHFTSFLDHFHCPLVSNLQSGGLKFRLGLPFNFKLSGNTLTDRCTCIQVIMNVVKLTVIISYHLHLHLKHHIFINESSQKLYWDSCTSRLDLLQRTVSRYMMEIQPTHILLFALLLRFWQQIRSAFIDVKIDNTNVAHIC